MGPVPFTLNFEESSPNEVNLITTTRGYVNLPRTQNSKSYRL